MMNPLGLECHREIVRGGLARRPETRSAAPGYRGAVQTCQRCSGGLIEKGEKDHRNEDTLIHGMVDERGAPSPSSVP